MLIHLKSYRRLDDARVTYQTVLKLDSRHSMALGFLGLVYHLSGDIDNAIIKYHEVCPVNFIPTRGNSHLLCSQSLSIDSINPHVLELLNMALELNTYLKPPAKEPGALGGAMGLLMAKYDRLRTEDKAAKGKERERVSADVPTHVGEVVDKMNVG